MPRRNTLQGGKISTSEASGPTDKSVPEQDSLVDPETGRLRVDTQSREYRRVRRRQWLELKRQQGYKRLDIFLDPEAYERLIELQENGEGISDTIARALIEYE